MKTNKFKYWKTCLVLLSGIGIASIPIISITSCSNTTNNNKENNETKPFVSLSTTNTQVTLDHELIISSSIGGIENFNVADAKFVWYDVTDANQPIIIENQTQSNLIIPKVDESWNNKIVQLVVTYDGQNYQSNTCIIHVTNESININISLDQTNISINEGDNLTINANITGSGFDPSKLSYQWYDLTNNCNIVGATSSSLSIDNIDSSWNNKQVQLIVTYEGVQYKSNTCTINVNQIVINVNLNITNINLTQGDNLTLTASISGSGYDANELTYQWWDLTTNKIIQGQTSSTLNINNIDLTWNNHQVQAIIIYDNHQYKSNICKINVNPKPLPVQINISLDQTNIKLNEGDNLTVNANITGSGFDPSKLSYQWYDLTNNCNIVGATSSSLSIDNIDSSWNNKQVQLIVTYEGVQYKSNTCTINVNPIVINVNLNQTNININEGDNLTINANITGSGYNPSKLSYQWFNVTDNEPIANQTSATLTINNINNSWNNKLVQLIVTYNDVQYKSNDCTINVNPIIINVTVNPTDIELTEGDSLIINSKVTGSGFDPSKLSYQWYDITNASDIPNQTSDTLKINNISTNWDNHLIKLKVIYNNKIYSSKNFATLTVNPKPVPVQINVSLDQTNIKLNEGDNLTINANITGSGFDPSKLSYQWYDLSNNCNIVGATSSSLSIDNIDSSWNNKQVQLIVTYEGVQYKSNTCIINVNPIVININLNTTNINLTQGDNLTLTASVSGSGYDANKLTYQWWDLTTNKIIQGQTSSTLNINNIDLTWNNHQVQAIVIYDNQQYKSNICKINVNPKPVPVVINVNLDQTNININEGDNLTISANITGIGYDASKLSYQWFNVTDNQPIANQTSATLTINNINNSWNNKVVQLIVTYNDIQYKSNTCTINVQTSGPTKQVVIDDEMTNFSRLNSYIIMIGDSTGTAWSYYYVQKENYFDWYLMTNWHVVKDVIKYNPHQLITNVYDRSVDPTNTYNAPTLSRADGGTFLSEFKPVWKTVQKVDVIADDDSQEATLFSNDTSSSHHYNLDMALVKIRFDSKPSFIDNQTPNPVQMYIDAKKQNPNFADTLLLDHLVTNSGFYMAGYPSGVGFTPAMMKSSDVELTPVLSQYSGNIKEGSIRIKNAIRSNQWPLSMGASGSASYYITDQNQDLFKTIPIGIYWGYFYREGDKQDAGWKRPCFAPFVYNDYGYSYNAYENFIAIKDTILK